MDQDTPNTEVTPVTEVAHEPTPAAEATTTPSAPATGKRSPLFYAGLAVVVLAVGGAIGWSYFDVGSLLNKQPAKEEAAVAGGLTAEEAAQPIAYVNGIAVTRGALKVNIDQVSQGAVAQGADLNDVVVKTQIEEQAYEISINNELLKQAAEKEAKKPSDEEVQAEIDRLTEQNGGAEAFKALLAEVGFTDEKLRENVASSLHIQAYLAAKQPESVPPTEKEISDFYDSLGGETAGIPPLKDVKAQVVAELERQKQDAQVTKILGELKATAKSEKVA